MGALVINGQKVAGVNIEIKPEIYSTEEREIGVWIDGKPLYEKTIYCPNIVKGQDNIINHNISNLETTVRIWGRCEYNNSGEILPLPYISSADGYFIILGNVTNTRFQVSPGNNFTSIENCYVTLQYTKTTDQPGSGTWTPDGVYAHHYSTDEKVVGTWIDGSTIYEITTDMGTAGVSVGAGASVDSNIPIGNVDKIVHSGAISQSGKCFPAIGAEQGDTYIKMLNMGSSNGNVRWFTIQYTKTS